MIPKDIHKIADKMGVSWDGDKNFMSWCQDTVGKRHLDDMTEVELTLIYTRLKNGKYPQSYLQECIVVGAKIKEDIVIAKNRDRNYYPRLKIVHEIINNIEVAYMLDLDTDYSDGMNEYGIGIINATLSGETDENEVNHVVNRNKMIPSKNGYKVRFALGFKRSIDVIKSIVTFTGYSDGEGVKTGEPTSLNGHTIIGTKKNIFSIENVSDKPAVIKRLKNSKLIVRTNHGESYPDAGYQTGIDRKSSLIRKNIAYKLLRNINSPEDILSRLNKKYDLPGWANPRRYNYKLWTTSQILMNLTRLELTLVVDKDTEFFGIERRLPNDYDSKIKINVKYE